MKLSAKSKKKLYLADSEPPSKIHRIKVALNTLDRMNHFKQW